MKIQEWISVKEGLPAVGEVVDIWCVHPPSRNIQTWKGTWLDGTLLGKSDFDGWRKMDMTFKTETDEEGIYHMFYNPKSHRRDEWIVENGVVTHWMKVQPPPKTPIREMCEECKGQGTYEVYHDDSQIVAGEAICHECNGEGFVTE